MAAEPGLGTGRCHRPGSSASPSCRAASPHRRSSRLAGLPQSQAGPEGAARAAGPGTPLPGNPARAGSAVSFSAPTTDRQLGVFHPLIMPAAAPAPWASRRYPARMSDLGLLAWPPEPIRTERLVLREPEALGRIVQAAVPWRRDRRVATPGPSSSARYGTRPAMLMTRARSLLKVPGVAELSYLLRPAAGHRDLARPQSPRLLVGHVHDGEAAEVLLGLDEMD